MDNFDELSDCSDSSKISECYSSDISTVSNLDEFRDEFLELKQLVQPSKSDCELPKSNISSKSIVTWYEKQIETLSCQLQNSLKQNEIYKSTVHNLETKNALCSGKVEKLLSQNQQLKDNLLAANGQVQRLLNIYDKTKPDTKAALLEAKVVQLEKNIYEFTNKNYLLSNELNQCNFRKSEIENELKKSRTEKNELKLELAAKTTSVDQLKTKISEQHVQLQEVCQNDEKLSHSIELVSNELDFVKKSEKWHKEELQKSQQEKRQLREKILENEKCIASQEETVEQIKLELNTLKCSCDEIRLMALKEKETLLKQLELANKHTTKNQKESNNSCDTSSNVGTITNHYESVISDLTGDVLQMKSNFKYQQTCLENASKEKSDILGKCVFLQNCLKDKEYTIEKLESIAKDLEDKLSFSTSRQNEQTLELSELKQACAKFQTEISLKNQDKQIFEESVTTVKKQFKLIFSKYTRLKNELHEKNREVLKLRYEKEESSIENDRRLFELRKSLDRATEDIGKLKQRVAYLETVEMEMEIENTNRLRTIEDMNIELVKLQQSNDDQRVQGSKLSENFTVKDKDVLFEDSKGEVNFSLLYSTEIEDVVKNICNLCKINYEDYLCFAANMKSSTNKDAGDFMHLLLNEIRTHIQLVQAFKTEALKKRVDKLSKARRNIVGRIFELMERCKILEIRNGENARVLEVLCSENDKNFHSSVEIQHLQTQLQVKAQEGNDKQKRYEKNYRTLLRKVKEHMKGRKATERHNTYLQELHNALSSECNTLKLELSLKVSEIDELESRLAKSDGLNEKLKLKVLKLEPKPNVCTKCADFGELKKTQVELEKSVKEYENSKSAHISELKLKEELLGNLQIEKKRLLAEIVSKDSKYEECFTRMEFVIKENKTLSDKILDVENNLVQGKIRNEQVQRDLKVLETEKFKAHNDNNLLNNELQHVADKNSHLLAELADLSSCLQSKSEEVIKWQQRKENSERRWLENKINMQNLISSLANQVRAFKIELATIKNEKFFLQRLCNDLKVALETHVAQNKALKQFFEDIHTQRENDSNESIILANFPSPVKYDDVQIDRLLKECEAPFQDKPFCDIQDGLAMLRMEILLLQNQISEKNVN